MCVRIGLFLQITDIDEHVKCKEKNSRSYGVIDELKKVIASYVVVLYTVIYFLKYISCFCCYHCYFDT